MRKTILLFPLMAFPFFLLFHPIPSADAAVTELSLNPVEDAYVDSDEPDSIFGGSSYLHADFWDYDYIPDVRCNSYLKFDLSNVSTEVNIVYARLTLYCWSAWSPTPDVGVHYCADDSWNENEITWNNAPSFSSVPTCVISVLDEDQWYTWDIGEDIKTALDDGILTVVLGVQNVGDSFHSSFYSKEAWDNHPRLVIGYSTSIFCSVSPLVVTLGDSVTVSGCIPIPRNDTVQLTYTRPNASTVVRAADTDSDGYFADTYTPDVVGEWSVTVAWGGAEDYNASSSTDMFLVTENKRDNWAIIIGVEDYKEIEDTWYSDKDAIVLYNKLREAWPEDHLKLLINEEATRSNIESAMKDWLAPNETGESVVLFFFSGHGGQGPDDVAPIDETDGKDEYICPYDSLTYSYDNDIRDDTLDSWLDSLDSQHISVFLHSCNSGGFGDLSKDERVIITACNETETAWEYRDLEHGVFPYYVLEGLDNLELLDDNGDNEISAEEMFDYVAPLVRNYTDWEQHPQMYDGYGGELTLITTVAINFDTNPFKASITIDGVTCTPPVSFVWPLYTEHTFHVSKQVWPEYGTRCLFTQWSDGNNLTSRTIIVSEFVMTNYAANYQTQHYLTVKSDYDDPQGAGWYDVGTTAYFGVVSLVDHGNGTRVVFSEWFGDISSTNSNSAVVMDAPKQVYAEWKTQYYLTIVSEYGQPEGEGWYDEDTTAHATIDTRTVSGATGVRYVFTEWSDDASGVNYAQSHPIVMNAPKKATANWKTQYYLTLDTDPSGLSPQPSLFPSGPWYDDGTDVTLTAQTISGYTFDYWAVDETSQDSVDTITATMDKPHTATAHYAPVTIFPRELLIVVLVTVVAVIAVAAVTVAALIKRRRKT